MIDLATLHQLATRHYENFPVTSWVLPREANAVIRSLYAFARVADDLADEGQASASERLEALDQWDSGLYAPTAPSPFFATLRHQCREHAIPLRVLSDLVQAFRLDAQGLRFHTEACRAAYCRYSAHPVGRAILALAKMDPAHYGVPSDAVCEGLQLINFLQDIAQDWQARGRLYLPLSDFQSEGITVTEFFEAPNRPAARAVRARTFDRAKRLLAYGTPLITDAPTPWRAYLAGIIRGGEMALTRLGPREDLTQTARLTVGDRTKVVWTMCRAYQQPVKESVGETG